MRVLRKGLKILAAVGIGLVALIVVAAAAMQTRTGKDLLGELVARALSGPDMTARVGTIEGMVPFDMRVSELRLADASGEFLVATNLAIAVVPRALLRGRVEIARLSAQDIAVTRLPETKPQATSRPLNLSELLHPSIAVVLDM